MRLASRKPSHCRRSAPRRGEMALLPQSLPVYDATDAVDTGLQSSRDKTAAIRCKEEIPLQ